MDTGNFNGQIIKQQNQDANYLNMKKQKKALKKEKLRKQLRPGE